MTLHEALTQSNTVAGRKIVTEYVYPPIPIRTCDWQATFEDYDLGDPVAHGATEAEAIANLIDLVS